MPQTNSFPYIQPTQNLRLSDLNDDILGLVCVHLTGKHALAVALVSKHLHHFAINRVVAVSVISDLVTLHTFHDYVLNTVHPRAQHIESLEVSYMALYQEEDILELESYRDTEDEVVPYSVEAVQLLINILQSASNLRALIL
ncbi:hypothetical protein C8Q80DRAFT_1090269, partial [Daedaleopsis nitida]